MEQDLTLDQFFVSVERYYGVEYRDTMKAPLRALLDGLPPGYYQILFRHLRINVSADYKSVPDEKAIRECMKEIDEAYPEFRKESYNQQITHTRAQIEDDAGAIPAALGRQYITDIMAAFRNDEIRPVSEEGRDGDTRMTPYEYEQRWKKEHGIG